MSHDSYQGSVFIEKGRPTYQMKYYDPALKKVVKRPTLVPVAEPDGKAEAQRQLDKAKLAFTGKATVRQWAETWLESRKPFPDHRNNKGHLSTWIVPALGDMVLDEVTPKDVNDLIQRVKVAERAPRTVRNIYSTLSAMFRDARIAGRLSGDIAVVASYPCILRARQLGETEDKESGWRAGAVFTRTELRMLITDERIPLYRRVQYAMLGVGALRDGEMCSMTWGELQVESPLNRMVVRRSHERNRTKTVPERWMPIHPALQEMLSLWAAAWPNTYGKDIGPGELVLPVVSSQYPGPSLPTGAMRNNSWVYHRWVQDLATLGLRHRRVHDLRRTFISLAIGDGADERLLKYGSHAAPRHVMGLYTSPEWKRVCAEVSKLRLSLLPVEDVEAETHLADLNRGPAKMVFGEKSDA
jgi:integrase